MREISENEVNSEVNSGEVTGDSAAESSDIDTSSEVREAEGTTEVSENDVDEDFSAELDEHYSSHLEDGELEDLEKNESAIDGGETSEDESLEEELDCKYSEYIDEGEMVSEDIEGNQGELTEEEKRDLKEETGWSDEVVDSIDTAEQADIYKNADLHEENINGRECLVKEIDYDYVDEKTGMTNRELMAKGRSPYDAKTGEKIELHHMGQKYDAPFAELTENSEHGDGNHSTLHPKTEGSWRNDETLEAQYRKEKREHWKTRSEV